MYKLIKTSRKENPNTNYFECTEEVVKESGDLEFLILLRNSKGLGMSFYSIVDNSNKIVWISN